MLGRIKMFNPSKSFGFIFGEDENDYFFHISQVKSVDLPDYGMKVIFEPNKNDKGFYANNVKIQDSLNDKIIVLDDQRIKATNIKSYGISSDNFYYEKSYSITISTVGKILSRKIMNYTFKNWEPILEETYDKIISNKDCYCLISAKKGDCISEVYDKEYNGGTIIFHYADCDGVFDINTRYNYPREYFKLTNNNRKTTSSDVKCVKEHYLYLSTYQGDNYKFYNSDVSFNIYDKLDEIDNILR